HVHPSASVLGRGFVTDALERASELDADRLSALLDEAVEAQVLNEVPRALGRYGFAHTLIRETLYAELRNLDRVRLHRRVAEVLEGLPAIPSHTSASWRITSSRDFPLATSRRPSPTRRVREIAPMSNSLTPKRPRSTSGRCRRSSCGSRQTSGFAASCC